ncbi:hypothetical protein BBO99_00006740 [Phytophthora kernoviae]|uniref:NADP-dependent oxidoreductase domain-containing protein n=1 Tax=Phytophthora kernoviae TaxID=325452 RepID=A0A421EVZ5_9STRA|nr:hypothetical protein BBI17_006762 [Phytophthora kernoviae]RLN77440.1 hypothetical protein BBO99_00006740 [Phytophthora kernoviae]
MNANIPTKTLPSGAKIPVVGLGVYLSEPGVETYNAVLSALQLGYRHIDTAQYYQNEADVGRAVKDSGISRKEIFVTSKLFVQSWGYEKALAATKASNDKLGLGYIDLFLLHAPGDASTRGETWRALEELREQGILKDIGVSNFGEAHLDKLTTTAKVKPAVNQVELHPWLMRPTLVKYCKENGIHLEAYSPLAKAGKLTDSTLLEIANEVGATPAQVLVAFSLANDFITLPKSVNPDRQKANLDAAKITLTPEQIEKLAALDEYLVTGWDPIKEHAVSCRPQAMSVDIPTKTLPSGAKIPTVGLGVYRSEPGAETYNAVLSALKLGYRLVDTAQYYENEADVGRAIRDSGIPREEIFVTTKLFIINFGYDKALATTRESNAKLGLGDIDLYLMHAPGDAATRDETWRAIEELHNEGILKNIGVSNFGETHLEKLLKTAMVRPAVNQIELHPWLMRPALVKYCQDNDILIMAHSPLAKVKKLDDPTLLEIANDVGATPAQVLVAFSLANGFVTLPKSVNTERQKSNLDAAKIKLSSVQIAKLAALDEYMTTAWDPIKDHAV